MTKRDQHFDSLKYLGRKFGKLTIIREFSTDGTYKGTLFLCKCECGSTIVKDLHSLKRKGKLPKSCGCLFLTRKGLSAKNKRLYTTFCHINDRCYNPKNVKYKYYGKRGIFVCEEWRSSFENFLNWSLFNGYKENLTLDRIDVNKGYSPDNCRWVDMHVQVTNRNINKNNTSGYVGVSWDKNRNKWHSSIVYNYKSISIGRYSDKKEALDARNRYIIEHNLTEYPIQEWRG
jgi:hypothetical protein